jgi:hypothetical protein
MALPALSIRTHDSLFALIHYLVPFLLEELKEAARET